MADPKLSVVLATDTYATIRPVIERLRRQTVREQLELVLVAPSEGAVDAVLAHRGEFAGIRIVENPVEDLAPARAAGIRAATAPFIFIGETHSYPHPGLAEALMPHFAGPWGIVVPALENANPNGALSWAAFLADYGLWVDGRPAGETASIPLYNAAFRREALLALGDQLESAIAHGEVLALAFRTGGHKAYFEPAARIDHVNVGSLGYWVHQRFALGVVIGNNRARDWPVARRALYVVASPLIPAVLCWRVLPGVWRTLRTKRVPLSTAFWVALGMVVKAGGELVAYAGASAEAWQRQNHEYELHKLAYAGNGPS